MTDSEKCLKNLRFTKDFNLPINIFTEDMFSYYRGLYGALWPYEEEDLMNAAIERYGNVEKWLEYCGSVRDRAISSVMETEEYKRFNTMDLNEKYPYVQVCGERCCYNEETHGKYFVSIDLKKANFQALKYDGVINDNTYEDFIYRMGGDEYIAKSKYLRQVIFGKMNPGRTIKIEKHIIYQIYLLVKDEILNRGYELYSMNSDELVFKENSIENQYNEEELISIEKKIKDALNIDIRAERVLIERLDIRNYRGNKVDAYIRWNLDKDEQILKKASTTFFPQIWKLWHGLEITEMDRMFFFEDQIATFNKPLELFDNDFEI